ncbi:hypothetical protein ACFWGI_37895 [Streptomyces niveus]|uniref:hypothetical protein n=1 Tax=Streptomyces niveus TaxID=193462 RepID=UPI0036680914
MAVVMLTPALPDELAILDALLHAGSPASFTAVVETAEVHAETAGGRHTVESLGRYCHTALPAILRRLLAIESELLTMRATVAGHAAAHERGDEPTLGELLEALSRAGIDLYADVEIAAALLDAEVRASAIG